jgi:hypothetical protein
MAGMPRRMLISGLWFISIWGVGGVLHFMLDVPRALTLVAAIAVATAVWILLARHDAWLETRRASIKATSTYRAESPVRALAPEA